jgi:hypothetical protein
MSEIEYYRSRVVPSGVVMRCGMTAGASVHFDHVSVAAAVK